MQVATDKVVVIHYTLKNDAGEVLDSSDGSEPLAYIHGNGNIIPGLEEALEGKAAGDKLQVKIEPAKAYGEHNPELIQNVPKRAFQGVGNVQAGMRFTAQTEHGPRQVVVTRVVGDMVTVDGNHPLAGQHLNFDVEITEIRDASREELEHGHVHGPGGHHHG
ncbi:MAG: peptidylprolyl isomerase [Steroidobacteraceae bacterium]|jgi:FKBP-type peptidyl-prolyl cis-trans isomerase SlyD|nr:peptidylprolyl isomerase [Steroidobacteraceae bacterium]